MQDIREQLQPYDALRDEAAVLALWHSTLGQTWPIQPARFRAILAGPEAQHFVVREDGAVIAFAATFKSMRADQKVGHLAALLVAPHRQGRGLGTALHTAMLTELHGLSAIQLGSTAPRFWCGVPGNLPVAVAFFHARGWRYTDGTVYDIVQDLSTYTTPLKVQQRMELEQIHFAPATSQNIADVLSFEAREFPHWLPFYQRYAELGDEQDLLAAYDAAGHVVGTLVMYSKQSHPGRTDLIWGPLLASPAVTATKPEVSSNFAPDADAGALGAVGIAASERGRGIGLALVARGTELLKARGVRYCYIDWVELTDFYGKLGYTKWRDYRLSWRTF